MQSQKKEIFPIMSWEMIRARNTTGLPDWQMAAFSDGEKIFICAALYAREREMKILVNVDNIDTVMVSGHIYVPTDWLMEIFPDDREKIKQIDETIRAKLPKKA